MIDKSDELKTQFIETKVRKEELEKKIEDLNINIHSKYDYNNEYSFEDDIQANEQLDEELKYLDKQIKEEEANKLKYLNEFKNNFGYLENENLFKKNIDNEFEINNEYLQELSKKVNYLKINWDFEEFDKIVNGNYNYLFNDN